MKSKMDQINPKFIKKAKFQKKINADLSQCLTCERKCKISKDKSGFCKTRINLDGEIYRKETLIPILSRKYSFDSWYIWMQF